jgi:hypothetical protein
MGDTTLDALLEQVTWNSYGGPAGIGSALRASHVGCIYVNGVAIRCYQLVDGRKILDPCDVKMFIDVMSGHAEGARASGVCYAY